MFLYKNDGRLRGLLFLYNMNIWHIEQNVHIIDASGVERVFRFSDDHSSAEKSGRQWPTRGTNFRCDSKNERATGTAGRTSKLNP
ncbi:hypothetical protein WYY_19254 [Bacillus velezensis M27]|nr:hypothetical protein CEG11_19525 [Bacillus velezensis]EKE45896.1 hypothetical protein WYY_19254 [Bacillus velezensis M27]